MNFRPELMGPHLATIVFAIVLALIAWKRPNLGRVLFVLMFGFASLINTYIALNAPDSYLAFASMTDSPVYRVIILGPFARHIVEYVLAIACLQAMIALGLTMSGKIARAAAVAGMVFLVAIAPLGIGSAFPSSLLMAGGLAVLARDGLDDTMLGRSRRRPRGPRLAH